VEREEDVIDWKHQRDAVSDILAAFDSGSRAVCFQLATGGGKSRVIRRITEHFHNQKKYISLVTHRKNLVRQLAGELREAGINFSLVASGYPMINTRIKVCSLQTMVNRFDQMKDQELIIVDECQHIRSKSYMKLFEAYPDAKILGVSATPKRTDGKPLSAVFDILIQGPSPRSLIDQGILCDYDYYAPDTIDMSGIHVSMGEYSTAETAARVDKKAIIGSVIGHYRKLADHRPAIVSCVSIDHAEHVAAQFRESGYRAQAVHSGMPDELVRRYINGLRDGTLELLMQCELLGEGVDIRGAEVLIQLRPTMSVVIFLQHIGRVLRGMPGKRAIILDHVSNYERFGMPDDPREWTLEGYDKVDKGILKYKRCPDCNRGNVPKASRSCPWCGHVWQSVEMELPQERDGTLVKLRGVELVDFELVSESFEEHKRKTIAAIAARAVSLKQAIEIAREHGYENHRFGYWVWRHLLKRKYA
jgi:superfamily II DNA or RNA helicase